MGKRRGQENEANYGKKSRSRIIIYSSSDDDESSNSDPEPVPGPSRIDDQLVAENLTTHSSETVDDTTPVNNTDSKNVQENVEVAIDDDLLLLLGEAPEPETSLGKAIHKDIASRWIDIVKKGLPKEQKEKLAKEYLIPSNCDLLVPPLLNPEAKAALTDVFVKRDASLMYRQKQTSNAIAALAQVIEIIISNKSDQELRQKILKPVNDACRILCDMHHSETIRRRKFVISSINTGMKETLSSSGTDKFLFGDNMAEKLKAAKNVQKSGEALKQLNKTVFNRANFYKNAPNKNQSNYKPLHQKTAGRQDAGRPSYTSRYQQSSSQNRAPDRAHHRARSPAPPPPRRNNRR